MSASIQSLTPDMEFLEQLNIRKFTWLCGKNSSGRSARFMISSWDETDTNEQEILETSILILLDYLSQLESNERNLVSHLEILWTLSQPDSDAAGFLEEYHIRIKELQDCMLLSDFDNHPMIVRIWHQSPQEALDYPPGLLMEAIRTQVLEKLPSDLHSLQLDQQIRTVLDESALDVLLKRQTQETQA